MIKSFETFMMASISDMPTIKYWENGKNLDDAKENILKECRICDACFTSLATIGENLFTRHPKNINLVHKDSNDLLSVIITLGTYVNVVETVFYSINMKDIGHREHVLNH